MNRREHRESYRTTGKDYPKKDPISPQELRPTVDEGDITAIKSFCTATEANE